MHLSATSSGPRGSRAPGTEAPSSAERWLRPLTGTMLVLLLLQLLIGMLVNFFVVVPDQHPGANAPEYFSGVARGVWWTLGNSGWELATHAGLGVLLGAISLALLVLAIVRRGRLWITITALGWVGVWGAGFNGASFLNYGHDFSSLLMVIGFLLALIAYAVGFYLTKPA